LSGSTIGLPLEGHSAWVSSVAFSSTASSVVSGGGDGSLRLWHIDTWQSELRYCCNTLIHHSALTFPPEGPEGDSARAACKVCEQVWTRQQSAEFLLAQGSALARTGEVAAAIAKFEEAKRLDAELALDPVMRANELAAWSGAK